MKEPSFREFYKPEASAGTEEASATTTAASPGEETQTPEEQIEAAYQTVMSALRADLLERIAQNSPAFFEQVIVDLLVAMGYGGSHKNAAAQLGRSGDGGVDGVINEDRLGLDRVYVRRSDTPRPARSGGPTSRASSVASSASGPRRASSSRPPLQRPGPRFVKHLSQRVILIDGERLADLMIEHGVGVRTSRAIEFKRLDEDFFAEEV